jgi:quercetin dioxygenase-like cupin family protein
MVANTGLRAIFVDASLLDAWRGVPKAAAVPNLIVTPTPTSPRPAPSSAAASIASPRSRTGRAGCRTGEMAVIDQLGYARLVDRKKDLIKSGGEWISSVELESLLFAHEAVADAAVVGVPDPVWGERPLGYVTPAGRRERPRPSSSAGSGTTCSRRWRRGRRPIGSCSSTSFPTRPSERSTSSARGPWGFDPSDGRVVCRNDRTASEDNRVGWLTTKQRSSMTVIEMTKEEMEASHVSRLSALQLWPIQEDTEVPQEARDLILARRLLTVAKPADLQGPFDNPSPIADVEGFSLNIAICPPRQGPGLHVHRTTTETFTCLRGTFRVYYGNHGEHETILEEFDTISIPKGVVRGFTNVGDEEGYLQVLITGDVRDMNDISFTREMRGELAAFGDDVVETIEARGTRFDLELD